jgi:hypothetical protein
MFILLLLISCLTTATTPASAEVTIDYSEVEINGEFPYSRDSK